MTVLDLAHQLLGSSHPNRLKEATSTRIHSVTETLETVEEALNRLSTIAPLSTQAWITCAHSPGARRISSPSDWSQPSPIRFPTSGEGLIPATADHPIKSWHLIHLGPIGWHWTVSHEVSDPDSITLTDVLLGRDGSSVLYRVTYESVEAGQHIELRPRSQRFIGFQS